MAEIITHSFVSAKTQSPDTTIVSKNEWNDGHVLNGGSNGQILIFDNTEVNNVKWVDGPTTASGTVTSGATASPYTSGTIVSITPSSDVTGIYVLYAIAVTSGGATYNINFKQNGADISAFGSIPSGQVFSYTQIYAPTAGSYSFTVVLTASAGTFTSISFSASFFTVGRA